VRPPPRPLPRPALGPQALGGFPRLALLLCRTHRLCSHHRFPTSQHCTHNMKYCHSRPQSLNLPDTRDSDLSPLRYEPCAQRTHVTAEGCEYSPTPQSVHCADPGISLYLPGTQLAQSPFLPDQPALLAGHARQYVDATTNSEYSPTLQSVHGIGPLWALCSPTPQPVQLPFVPVQPGLRSMLPRVVWRASHSIHTAYTMRAPDTHRRQERPGGSGIDGSVTPDQLERAASHFYLKEIIQAIC